MWLLCCWPLLTWTFGLVCSAARLKEAGQPFVIDAAIAKLRASEVAEKVASLCIKYATPPPFSDIRV